MTATTTPSSIDRRFKLFYSSPRFVKIKKIFSWHNSVKIFNSLKFVDMKFGKDTPTKTKKSDISADIEPPFDFEPMFFFMPNIVKKEFDRFNAVVEENKVTEASQNNQAISTPTPTSLSHQFLPQSSFMNQVMAFRNSSIKQDKEERSIKGFIKNLFIKPKPIKPMETDTLGRKISLLGFHGWFPNRLIQKVIGDPRGTSARMVDMLEIAINESDPFPPFCEGPAAIYKFPLQGEGTIEERVKKHLEELESVSTNYGHEGQAPIQHLKESDTIILGAHSQGAPVAIILLAKLLDSGVIDLKRQKVTILTVAGIFHGPFPPLRKNLVVQYVEADAARQLFDLNNPDSEVSKLFASSLNKVLQSGINISCVASWLDQVVPFYSACLLGFEHPNIWRSVHINADHYRPDFLTKLVEIGLKIKNTLPGLGEPETHMILAEVSEYIAGSIYQHATHSSAYRKLNSYQAALDWMKMGPGTKNIPIQPVDHIRHRPLQSTVNPYYLPWLFRGWLNSPEVLNNFLLAKDFIELQELYKNWKPESKLLKDFKFKLEPISLQSKL